MRLRRNSNNSALAITLIETLVVIVVIALLAILILPRLGTRHTPARRIKCASNLRSTTLAVRLWAADNGERFPWQVSTNLGGTFEIADSTNVWLQWYAMRKVVETPKVLHCPADTNRQDTRLFTDPDPKLTSYALNFSAILGETNSVLILDRNVVRDGVRLRAGWQMISTNARLAWGKDIHRTVGNYSLIDGSVVQADSDILQKAFCNSPVNTNRLLIP